MGCIYIFGWDKTLLVTKLFIRSAWKSATNSHTKMINNKKCREKKSKVTFLCQSLMQEGFNQTVTMSLSDKLCLCHCYISKIWLFKENITLYLIRCFYSDSVRKNYNCRYIEKQLRWIKRNKVNNQYSVIGLWAAPYTVQEDQICFQGCE